MKICAHCGAQQSDERHFCVDFGEPLGKSLGKAAEDAVKEQLEAKTEQLYNEADPLHVSRHDIAAGCLSVFGIIGAALYLMFGGSHRPEIIYSILSFVLAAVNTLVPGILWW